MNKIRSFIAIEFSDEARNEISRIEELLKKADADVKWVAPGSVHMTLKFLGSVPEEKIPCISGRLKDMASEIPAFDISLEDVGVFPKWEHIKVLWIGIGQSSERVRDLAERVEQVMAQEGFDRESRAFRSHLTIGRVRSAKNRDKIREIAGSIKVRPVSCRISRVALFKSDLLKSGAVHSRLSVFDLKG